MPPHSHMSDDKASFIKAVSWFSRLPATGLHALEQHTPAAPPSQKV